VVRAKVEQKWPAAGGSVPPTSPQLTVAVDAARAAGLVLRDHFGRPQQIEHKGEIDLVTALDRRAESLVVERLRAAFPDHAILAEEGSGGGASARDRWLVDPLDGTTNYAHGYPFFAVSIAYEHAGRIVVGVIYDPLQDELFVAEAGGGAWLNGRPLRVSGTVRLVDSLLITGFPYDRALFPAALRLWDAFMGRAQALRRAGAAALDLAYVAAGRGDGFWERPLQPWDMAAGVLLVEEAGGQVSDYRGGPADIYSGEIVASNGAIHDQMLAVIAAADGE
jgi:myo-inositol-1(or 4)-monophosphatase